MAVSDENLALNNINLIINATKELPTFPSKDQTIESARVPVYDACDENILPYFKVTKTIDNRLENRSKYFIIISEIAFIMYKNWSIFILWGL